MSQRGSRPKKARKRTCAPTWGHVRTVLPLTLALTLGATLSLVAQNTEPSTPPAAKTVVLRVDGAERQVSTVKATVLEVLHQEGVVLNPHDRCEPPVTAAVADGMTITVARVTFEVVKERYAIPAAVETRWNRRMTATPIVIQEGRDGVGERTRCIWRMDGVISEQWTQNPRVITAPRPKVIVRGNLPSRSGSYGRVISVTSTAYTPYDAGCNAWTATGLRARRGVIAVDPRVIALGTRVYVEGYGEAVAADTGGAIKGYKIDVCFPTRREAFQWGRRTVKVIILQ